MNTKLVLLMFAQAVPFIELILYEPIFFEPAFGRGRKHTMHGGQQGAGGSLNANAEQNSSSQCRYQRGGEQDDRCPMSTMRLLSKSIARQR
ncbi:hypothetical protein D3C73_1290300 [compost metagenome]